MLYQPDPGPVNVDPILGNYVQREYQKLAGLAKSDNDILEALVNGTVRADILQAFTEAQQGQARVNIGSNKRRNLIQNGNMRVNQSGFTSFTTQGLMIDRWRALKNGPTWTCSHTAFGVSGANHAVIKPNAYAAIRANISNSGSGTGVGAYGFFDQGVDASVIETSGRTYTLTFFAIMGPGQSGKIGVSASQFFGTGGSPSATVGAISPMAHDVDGLAWKKCEQLITFPTIAGKTIGTDFQDRVLLEFWFTHGSNFNTRAASIGFQTGDFYITNVSLTEGDNRADPAPFDERSLTEELMLCERFYQLQYVSGQTISSAIGQDAIASYQFHPPLRGIPTCTVLGAGTAGNSTVITDVGALTNAGGYTQYRSTAVGGFYLVGRLLGFSVGY